MLKMKLTDQSFFNDTTATERFEKFVLEADVEADLAFKHNGSRNAKVVREIIGMILSRRILNLGNHGVMLICDERNNTANHIGDNIVIVDVLVSKDNKVLQLRFEYGGNNVSG